MKKEFVLQLVENSASSIFSREDVIKLINSVEGGGRVISVDDIQRAIDQTIYWIENNSDHLIDEDSAEFELDYNNRITLSNVNIDVEEIREALENNFMDFGEAVDDVVELERVSGSEFVPVDEERDDE
jgi:hypothetical protein